MRLELKQELQQWTVSGRSHVSQLVFDIVIL